MTVKCTFTSPLQKSLYTSNPPHCDWCENGQEIKIIILWTMLNVELCSSVCSWFSAVMFIVRLVWKHSSLTVYRKYMVTQVHDQLIYLTVNLRIFEHCYNNISLHLNDEILQIMITVTNYKPFYCPSYKNNIYIFLAVWPNWNTLTW